MADGLIHFVINGRTATGAHRLWRRRDRLHAAVSGRNIGPRLRRGNSRIRWGLIGERTRYAAVKSLCARLLSRLFTTNSCVRREGLTGALYSSEVDICCNLSLYCTRPQDWLENINDATAVVRLQLTGIAKLFLGEAKLFIHSLARK